MRGGLGLTMVTVQPHRYFEYAAYRDNNMLPKCVEVTFSS